MRRFASSVTVITTRDKDERACGLLATSVGSVCAEPPTLMVSIDKRNMTHDRILNYGAFCASVLSAGQEAIAALFGDPTRRNDRFTGGEWFELETGCPVLADAAASFDCLVVGFVRYHSHTIFLGQVKRIETAPDKRRPLLHFDRRFGPLHGFECPGPGRAR
jgi:flavin reductase